MNPRFVYATSIDLNNGAVHLMEGFVSGQINSTY